MKIISNTKNDSIKRVEEIYKVLKKNDFGYLIEENTFFKNFPFLKDTKRGKYKELPDESIPKRIKDVLEELGPTYIKLGQMLSTRPRFNWSGNSKGTGILKRQHSHHTI